MIKKNSTKSTFVPLPDFELADLRKFPPDFLKSTDPKKRNLNAFILMISLVFNDLKGLLWVIERLVEGEPKQPGISSYRGQWGGFNSQYKLLVIGLLWELLEAIKENKSALDHPDFKSCLEKQTKKIKLFWDILVNHATQRSGKKPKTDLGITLFMIRNNASFHYYQTKNI
nr:hypothetical protein [Deltaproteobacteria bacterium]